MTPYNSDGFVTPLFERQNSMQTQIGGDHYTKLAIQPMTYSMENKLDACQHTAIKYITRFRDKGGRQDLLKAIQTIEMLIKFEYGEAGKSD